MYSRKFVAMLVYYATGIIAYAIIQNKYGVQAIVAEFKEFVFEQKEGSK